MGIDKLEQDIKAVIEKYRGYCILNPNVDYQDFAWHEIFTAMKKELKTQGIDLDVIFPEGK